MTRRMARVFTGGSAADLIAQLIKSENLSEKEIEELRRIAADKITGAEKKSPSSRSFPRRSRKRGGVN